MEHVNLFNEKNRLKERIIYELNIAIGCQSI